MTLEWLIAGIITAAAVVIWWGVKWSINRVTTRFDTLIAEVQKLGKSFAYQQGLIRAVKDEQRRMHKRLNNHSDRLRDIETGKVGAKN